MAFEQLELTERLRLISQLTEKLMAIEYENAEAKALGERISREIEAARQQLRDLRKPK